MEKSIYEASVIGNYPEKKLMVANNMGIYEKEKEMFIKGGFGVEVIGAYGNQVKW